MFVQAASEGLPLPQSEAAAELQTPASAERLLARPDEVRGLINLDVVVTDNSGKPVPGLKPRDFSLLDNGQPQKILYFSAFDGNSHKPALPVVVVGALFGPKVLTRC